MGLEDSAMGFVKANYSYLGALQVLAGQWLGVYLKQLEVTTLL